MVHSMTASKQVQVWVTGGSGCSEPHWEAETGRRWGEESIGVLILPAKATALKHRLWNRNGASTLEEQLQACGGLCRSLEGLWVFWDGITRLSAGASWFGIAQWDSYTFDSVGNFELDTLYKAPSTILFRIQWMPVTGPGLGPNWEMWMGGRERMRQVLSPVTVLWGPCFYFGKWNTERQHHMSGVWNPTICLKHCLVQWPSVSSLVVLFCYLFWGSFLWVSLAVLELAL